MGTPSLFADQPVFSQLIFYCVDPATGNPEGSFPITGYSYGAGEATEVLNSTTGTCFQGATLNPQLQHNIQFRELQA